MSTNFTPGLRKIITLGGNVLPTLQGCNFSMPKNYEIPWVFSGESMFQFAYVEGLQFPTVRLNLAVTQDWFTVGNLQNWFVRSGAPQDDVASAGILVYWDGAHGVSVPVSKVASLSLGASRGNASMRCQLVLVGAGEPAVINTKPDVSVLQSNVAGFHHVALSGGLANAEGQAASIAAWDLVISNNPDVSPELNGTPYPAEHNAGPMTGTMRLVQQAHAAKPANGTECIFTVTPPAGTPLGIHAKHPLCMDPEERTDQMVRQMREYNFTLLGESAILPPVKFA